MSRLQKLRTELRIVLSDCSRQSAQLFSDPLYSVALVSAY